MMTDRTSHALHNHLHAFTSDLNVKLAAILNQQHPVLQEALMFATLLGGKRIRPFLTFQIGSLLGVAPHLLLHVGAAIEMIHAYSLVHDDLPSMDNADTRRGLPSCHKKFSEAEAILTGDGLLTLAFQMMASEEAHPDPATRCHMISCLAQASGPSGMVAGQALDMHPLPPANLQDLSELHHLKSGALIQASCLLPALMAHAPDPVVEKWKRFGAAIGLSFQIVDDILDVRGDPTITGKPGFQDGHKATFVTLMGLEAVQDQAQTLLAEAKELLHKMSDSSTSHPHKAILMDLVTYIGQRES